MENKTNYKGRIFVALLWCMPVIFLLTLVFITPSRSISPQTFSVTEKAISFDAQKIFGKIKIEAKAVIIKDLNTGEILYEKNAHIPLPLASLTKIMTAIVTREYADGLHNVFISRSAMRPDDVEQLNVGETFSLKKLIDYMMVASSNDSAAAIALAVQNVEGETSFVEKMNHVAKSIGMPETHFLNETGLDENEAQAGAYGSAFDVISMLEYSLTKYPDVLDATRESDITAYSASGYPHKVSNTNTIIGELPNVVASKTGYTDLAGGNLVVVIDPGLNRPVAIAVLGSSYEGRFTDVKALSEGVSKYFSLLE